jgi:hypothetical protein
MIETSAFLLSPSLSAQRQEDAHRVETTTLLPGGAIVSVRLRHAVSGFVVDDEAVGRTVLSELGVQDLTGADTRRGNQIADARGVRFDGASFSLDEVSEDGLQSAIVYVADASRSWVEAALDARARRPSTDLTARSKDKLRAILPNVRIELDRELIGESSKRHRFDIVVSLANDRLALFQTLTLSPNALAAAYLKFDDVMRAHPDWPREAVVEDLSIWPSPDLAVMQHVTTHVRSLVSDWSDLTKLAA